MEELNQILPRVLRRMGASRQVRQARVEAALSRAAGDFLRPYVRVMAVQGSTLVLACAHPAVAHQLQLEADRLLEAVNAEVDGGRLTRLRFVAEVGRPPAPGP
ncbi:MAG: DUF721 domain-containing protein [Candidatus Dormibacteria bacterium]